MNADTLLYSIPAAFILDFIIGDPQSRFHPIRWMGKAISLLEPKFRRLPVNSLFAGAFFSISLILCTWLMGALIVKAAGFIHPIVKTVVETLIFYYCISAKALVDEADGVAESLRQDDLIGAKKKLCFIVGREVDRLDEKGVVRAAVETVAENLVDGVLSPLFFAAIGGAPLAMAYKMVNTLDSMVGYKNERYIRFGKTAARIDDIANFLPARLCVPIIALSAEILSSKGKDAWDTAVKEGPNHLSPNAGYSEAAFAGALGVKLGGPNYYHGQLVEKPYIGQRCKDAQTADIDRANLMMILCCLLWFAAIWAGIFLRAL